MRLLCFRALFCFFEKKTVIESLVFSHGHKTADMSFCSSQSLCLKKCLPNSFPSKAKDFFSLHKYFSLVSYVFMKWKHQWKNTDSSSTSVQQAGTLNAAGIFRSEACVVQRYIVCSLTMAPSMQTRNRLSALLRGPQQFLPCCMLRRTLSASTIRRNPSFRILK